MRCVIVLTALLGLSCMAFPQPGELVEQISRYLEESGSEAGIALLAETINELSEEPLDLNNASEEELSACGLFTPFQVFGIVQHRERYGPFFSVYEVAAIPGFRRDFLEMTEFLLRAGNFSSPPLRRRPDLLVLSNFSMKYPLCLGSVPSDSGYRHYSGSALKTTQRMKFTGTKKWSAALTCDKDAGEPWITGSRPEHLAGYVSLNPGGKIREVILGNFRVHRGMGLVNGLGFRGSDPGFPLNGFRRSYARPYASSMEYDYYRGICSSFRAGKLDFDAFASLKPEDLSLHAYPGLSDLYEMTRKTGLHRTGNEMQGIGLAKNLSGGISVNRSALRWNAGMAVTGSRMYLSRTALDSLGLPGPFTSDRTNLSVYGAGYGDKLEWFAELALDQRLRIASLAGIKYEVHPALMVSLTCRYYGNGFTGQVPNALLTGGNSGNQSGLSASMDIVPFPRVKLIMAADISRKLALPDRIFSPGYRTGSLIRGSYSSRNGLRVDFSMKSRSSTLVLKDEKPGNGGTAEHIIRRYSMRYRYPVTDRIQLEGKCILSLFRSEGTMDKGQMIYQQLSFRPVSSLQIVYRYQLFQADDWENRIYAYEPGVRYSFSFPALYGTGSRNMIMLSYSPGRQLTFRLKAGMTAYAYRWETGSGWDAREGSRVRDVEFQVQVDL